MAFRKLPNNKGLIYVPDCIKCPKKNPCRDCFSCQWCSDDRCLVCCPVNDRSGRKEDKKKSD